MRNEIHQQAIIGHVVFQVRVRPVGAPENAVRELIDDALGKGDDVCVIAPNPGFARPPKGVQPVLGLPGEGMSAPSPGFAMRLMTWTLRRWGESSRG